MIFSSQRSGGVRDSFKIVSELRDSLRLTNWLELTRNRRSPIRALARACAIGAAERERDLGQPALAGAGAASRR